ncbi:ABC transporter substrate-binding protein [Pseudooceanicola aestuarii]|uniref:ABC transporter substrate-binding protein n=1 Tax=Pseudooceanicola aestuarii TaxID=2697319 RepID=UPI0013D49562|nr:ABC transporter substrate-binding protein [Pseudooceanicola aestuarii]
MRHIGRRTLIGAMAALGLAGLQATEAGAQTRGVSDDEIVLGTHMDLSGPAAAGMPPIVAGLEVAVKELNAAGGIHGRQLRLVVEDNGYQPGNAVRAVQKMATRDNVFAIVSPFGTGTSAAGYAVAAKMGVPHLFPWTGVPEIFHKTGDDRSFTYVADYGWVTQAGVEWLIAEKGAQRIGILYQDDAFGQTVIAGVEAAAKATGTEVVETASYKSGALDFSAQVTKLRNADADLVVLATLPRETIGSYTTIRRGDWDVDVVTSIPGRSQVVPLLAKGTLDGLYGIGQWNLPGDDETPEAQAWIAQFAEDYPGLPSEGGIVSYMMMMWVAQALEAAGPDLTAESFAAAMEGSTYEDKVFRNQTLTLTDGHIAPEVASVWQVDDVTWRKLSDDITE